MHSAARQDQPIRTFCIGNDLSPYLKTLAELHVLNVSSGSIDNLSGLLTKHQFPTQLNDPNGVVLSEAGVTIRETPIRIRTAEEIQRAGIVRQSSAPDHLARLFFYNHLLQRIGRNYFAPNYQTANLIEEAQRAHIVSPLSSLVVLETENDYNRFGIKKDINGLDNATLKSEGAVPEPHEWALLAMTALFVGWIYWRKSHAIL
jgi:XrtN system VIT domain protein